MPLYAQYFPESLATIKEALIFAIEKIKEDASKKKQVVDKSHHKLLDEEYGSETERIFKVITFMEKDATGYGTFRLDAKSHESYMSIIRSALEIYLQDTLKAKTETGLSRFDSKIQEIRRIMSLEGLKIGNPNLYSRYYQPTTKTFEGGEMEVFFSYANEDRVLAGKIADLLKKREIAVFLAHEDIEVSKEWRDEILMHLKKDKFLLALLTAGYEKSVWANQEAGYVIGNGGRSIPLIVGEIELKKFGFLESYQGIHVDENKLEESVEKIVDIVTK